MPCRRLTKELRADACRVFRVPCEASATPALKTERFVVRPLGKAVAGPTSFFAITMSFDGHGKR